MTSQKNWDPPVSGSTMLRLQDCTTLLSFVCVCVCVCVLAREACVCAHAFVSELDVKYSRGLFLNPELINPVSLVSCLTPRIPCL